MNDQPERGIDLILQLGSETDLALFVVVDLTINLGNREPMNAKIHRCAYAALRCRTCARGADVDAGTAETMTVDQ